MLTDMMKHFIFHIHWISILTFFVFIIIIIIIIIMTNNIIIILTVYWGEYLDPRGRN
jgi:hypothetical protein